PAAAAVLIFFPAPAGASFVATDLRQRTANRKIDRYSAVSIAVAVSTPHRGHRADWMAHARVGGCSWRVRPFFAEQELRQRREEILERLKIGSAAKQIVQNFILNVRH